jgi:NMD protein affecting ribosome stability and mRNA decay
MSTLVRCKDCGEKGSESVIAFVCEDCYDIKLNEFLSQPRELVPE